MTHPWTHAQQTPDSPALITPHSGETRSYRDLVANANRWSHLFLASGLKSGDTIALLLENRIEYLEICWVQRTSGCITPVSARIWPRGKRVMWYRTVMHVCW